MKIASYLLAYSWLMFGAHYLTIPTNPPPQKENTPTISKGITTPPLPTAPLSAKDEEVSLEVLGID